MARAGGMVAERPILCLPPATGELPEQGGLVVSSPATPFRKQIEHAGHVYQQKLIRTYAVNQPSDADSSSEAEDTPSNHLPHPQAKTDAAKTLASKMAIGSDDLYELLELGDKRWHATADDIKKSFRRISLLYHPDKISHQGEQARENSEAHFKSVMKAYDILSDKKKRAAYDSIDDVDDTIPTEKDATSSPERFYEKFGACFALNARWCVSDRVPELGDDTTDIETVNRFYDFWYSFKSWRDFSFDLEYDTDQAECREEKRWMERQNAKHVKAKKLEENARLRRLVDLAYKHDPRLARIKQAEKAKKNAAKEERKRKAEEAARLAKEEEERERLQAEKKAADDKMKRAAAKKQKDAARQVMRKARQKLRAVGRELALMDSDRGLVAIEGMCTDGTVESIEAVTALLAALPTGVEDTVGRALAILDGALSKPHAPAKPGKDVDEPLATTENSVAHAAATTAPQPVSEEEKAEANGTKPESQSLANGHTSEKKPTEIIWTAEELSLLSKAVVKFPGGTRDRWNRLAEYVGTKSADEVLRKVNESRPSKIKAGALKQPVKQTNGRNAFERFQEKKKGKPVVPQGKATGSQAGSVTQPPNRLQFTPKQQLQFEAALKKFPATEGEGRWKKVSSAVGRTPEHCKERFMELIAYYQSRKAAK